MDPINSLSGLRRQYETDPARASSEASAFAGIDRLIANGEARRQRMANMGRNPALEINARNAAAGTYGTNTRGITLSGPGNGSSNSLREAAAYAASSPGLRRGGDVFGRNDRFAALQRNRDFIASGRASMFGPRPATTKGKLAMLQADLKREDNAHEMRLEGLRAQRDVALENTRQGGQMGLERLKQRGENYRAGLDAEYKGKLLTAQEKANEDMQKMIGQPSAEKQAQEDRLKLEKANYKRAQYDPETRRHYWTEGEGENQRREYFGDEMENSLWDDWERNNWDNAQFRNGRWFVPDESGGAPRFFRDASYRRLMDAYSNNPSGAIRDDATGQWTNHGAPVSNDLATYLENQRDTENNLKLWASQYARERQRLGTRAIGSIPVIGDDGRLTMVERGTPLPPGARRANVAEMGKIQQLLESNPDLGLDYPSLQSSQRR